jgi:hypothetical protein
MESDSVGATQLLRWDATETCCLRRCLAIPAKNGRRDEAERKIEPFHVEAVTPMLLTTLARSSKVVPVASGAKPNSSRGTFIRLTQKVG